MPLFLVIKSPFDYLIKKHALMLSVLLFTLPIQSKAMFEESTFQKAREAYASKNELLLSQYASELKTKAYLLAPYTEYWLMLLRLEKADDIEVLQFLEANQAFPFANRMRGEWLKKLAKQAQWPLFFEQFAQYQVDDVALQCENLYGRAVTNKEVDAQLIKTLWLTSQDQPSQCNRLFDLMRQNGTITIENSYERLRLALLDGKPNLAKSILQNLPNTDASDLKLVDRAYQAPASFLNKRSASLKLRLGAELNVFALDRLARDDQNAAQSKLKELQFQFEPTFRSLAWNRIAYQAARALDPNAMAYFSYAKPPLEIPSNLLESLTYKEIFAWRTRAALRAGHWPEVLNSIAMMSEKQAQESPWRYWKARALKATGENSSTAMQEATTLFSQLAKERHYYGWLAAEELEASIASSPDVPYVSKAEEVDAIAKLPAIARAVALKNVDMRWEAKLEWQAATRNMNDQALLAAANYAQKLKWYDVAIATADSTKEIHNFDLRYPTPYQTLFKYASDEEQVDEAWIYGLTRQESRFMDEAKSTVGASGLMQLMPATAKWAAKQKGLFAYHHAMIHDLSTNIALGTFYMRHTLDLLGGQVVLATAAYNAGPNRAKRWMADAPLEAAIYIETIPFSETRNYVQKVMANAHLYAPRVGVKIQSLKARLGLIPARSLASE